MRVAIIGANGQLGADLVRAFKAHEVVAWTRRDFDVCDHERAALVIVDRRPEVVINTAAYHNTEECEKDPVQAFAVNAVAVGNLATTCHRLGAVFVHISTDYVFGGEQDAPYSEDDRPSPVNVYGISKLAGEHFVARLSTRHYIIRVASLYGGTGSTGKGGSFVERILSKAVRGEEIRIVNDVRISPTYTVDAADRIREIVQREVGGGIFHVTNSGTCTWYEFAQAVFTFAGARATLHPWTLREAAPDAPRPKNSALVSRKLESLRLSPLRPWQEALAHYFRARGARLAEMAIARE